MEYGDFSRGRRTNGVTPVASSSSRELVVPDRSTRVIVPQQQSAQFIEQHEARLRKEAGQRNATSRRPDYEKIDVRSSFALPMPTASTADIDSIYAAKGVKTTFFSIRSLDRDVSRYNSASNFHIELSKRLKAMVRMRLVSLEFENPEEIVNATNNVFSLELQNGKRYTFSIPPGNWNTDELCGLIQKTLWQIDPYILLVAEIDKETQRSALSLFKMEKLLSDPVQRSHLGLNRIEIRVPASTTVYPDQGEKIVLTGLDVVPDNVYEVSEWYDSTVGRILVIDYPISIGDDQTFGGHRGWMGLPLKGRLDFSVNNAIGRTLGFFPERTSKYLIDYNDELFAARVLPLTDLYLQTKGGSNVATCVFFSNSEITANSDLYPGQVVNLTNGTTSNQYEVLDFSQSDRRIWMRPISLNTIVEHGPLPRVKDATMFKKDGMYAQLTNTFSYTYVDLNELELTSANGTKLSCLRDSIRRISHASLGSHVVYRAFCKTGLQQLGPGPYNVNNFPSELGNYDQLYVLAHSKPCNIFQRNSLSDITGLARGVYVFLTPDQPPFTDLTTPVLLPMAQDKATAFYMQSETRKSEQDPDLPRTFELPMGIPPPATNDLGPLENFITSLHVGTPSDGGYRTFDFYFPKSLYNSWFESDALSIRSSAANFVYKTAPLATYSVGQGTLRLNAASFLQKVQLTYAPVEYEVDGIAFIAVKLRHPAWNTSNQPDQTRKVVIPPAAIK